MGSQLRPKKSLSQHFLRDKKLLKRIVDYAGLSQDDVVLEIGAGTGILTQALCGTGARVIAIEKDSQLVSSRLKPLEKKYENLSIVEADALEIQLPEFTKVVSNLPYRISSAITFKLLEQKFELGILMYQREFAERMCALPPGKDYGKLSVNVYVKARAEILEIVPRGAFQPMPKVESAIVRLLPREKPPFEIASMEIFNAIVNLAFQHRRKKIGTVLTRYWRQSKALAEFLKQKNYYEQRAENLKPEDFGVIANFVFVDEKKN